MFLKCCQRNAVSTYRGCKCTKNVLLISHFIYHIMHRESANNKLTPATQTPSMFLHIVTWHLTFWPQNHSLPLVGYPKLIPYTTFEDFGIIRFWVIVRTHTHTNVQTDADDRVTHSTPACANLISWLFFTAHYISYPAIIRVIFFCL